METSSESTGEQLSLWTSFAEATHASHSATLEGDKANKTQDTYGPGLGTPLAHLDPATRSWRTSEDISLWGDYPLLQTLPISGTTQSGVLYQQPDWEPLIDVKGSLLWPTPRAAMWKNRKWWRRPSGNHHGNLEEVGALKKPELLGQEMNPEWIEWLMGFPIGWTELEA
jgi:hypothetical protein